VSLPCDWSCDLLPLRGSKARYFSIGFTKEINESSEYSKSGAAKSPGLGLFPSSKIFLKNNIYMSALVTPSAGLYTVAAESLKIQLHSQGKLTTPRRENRKIRHEIEISKANEPEELQIYRMTPNHMPENLLNPAISLYILNFPSL
jgi:hypothetical protein